MEDDIVASDLVQLALSGVGDAPKALALFSQLHGARIRRGGRKFDVLRDAKRLLLHDMLPEGWRHAGGTSPSSLSSHTLASNKEGSEQEYRMEGK